MKNSGRHVTATNPYFAIKGLNHPGLIVDCGTMKSVHQVDSKGFLYKVSLEHCMKCVGYKFHDKSS